MSFQGKYLEQISNSDERPDKLSTLNIPKNIDNRRFAEALKEKMGSAHNEIGEKSEILIGFNKKIPANSPLIPLRETAQDAIHAMRDNAEKNIGEVAEQAQKEIDALRKQTDASDESVAESEETLHAQEDLLKDLEEIEATVGILSDVKPAAESSYMAPYDDEDDLEFSITGEHSTSEHSQKDSDGDSPDQKNANSGEETVHKDKEATTADDNKNDGTENYRYGDELKKLEHMETHNAGEMRRQDIVALKATIPNIFKRKPEEILARWITGDVKNEKSQGLTALSRKVKQTHEAIGLLYKKIKNIQAMPDIGDSDKALQIEHLLEQAGYSNFFSEDATEVLGEALTGRGSDYQVN